MFKNTDVVFSMKFNFFLNQVYFCPFISIGLVTSHASFIILWLGGGGGGGGVTLYVREERFYKRFVLIVSPISEALTTAGTDEKGSLSVVWDMGTKYVDGSIWL